MRQNPRALLLRFFFFAALGLSVACKSPSPEDCGNGFDDDCDGDIDCADEDCQVDYPAIACTPAEDCCRVCESGKPCGDSCIDVSSECSAGEGCACAAADVCTGDELTPQEQCEVDFGIGPAPGGDPYANCPA